MKAAISSLDGKTGFFFGDAKIVVRQFAEAAFAVFLETGFFAGGFLAAGFFAAGFFAFAAVAFLAGAFFEAALPRALPPPAAAFAAISYTASSSVMLSASRERGMVALILPWLTYGPYLPSRSTIDPPSG